nr:MAG TPA: hypothetical protein [Caudoviricetes sp.]
MIHPTTKRRNIVSSPGQPRKRNLCSLAVIFVLFYRWRPESAAPSITYTR